MALHEPSEEEFLRGTRVAVGGTISIEKSVSAYPGLIREHTRSRAYAMPTPGVFDEEVRTLIYLAAVPGSKPGRARTMADRIGTARIVPKEAREVVHIVRFATATRTIGDEPVFDPFQPLLEAPALKNNQAVWRCRIRRKTD
jgi:hypothetical protein